MCGRFSLEQYPKLLLDLLNVGPIDFVAREQIYPTNDVHVIFEGDSEYEITLMNWGWERSFSKRPLINTRGQEAWGKKTWVEAMHKYRCIIPASSFYEWNQNQPKGKRDRYKIKHACGPEFAMGGLYEVNQKSGEMFVSVLTTQPNKKMSKIHHRMPVIIKENNMQEWLTTKDKLIVDELMAPLNDTEINVTKE